MQIRINITAALHHGRSKNEHARQQIIVPIAQAFEAEILTALRSVPKGLPNERLEISLELVDSVGQRMMDGATQLKVS